VGRSTASRPLRRGVEQDARAALKRWDLTTALPGLITPEFIDVRAGRLRSVAKSVLAWIATGRN